MRLKIGCIQTAKLMIAKMAIRTLRIIAAKETRIIACVRHSNANKKKRTAKQNKAI